MVLTKRAEALQVGISPYPGGVALPASLFRPLPAAAASRNAATRVLPKDFTLERRKRFGGATAQNAPAAKAALAVASPVKRVVSGSAGARAVVDADADGPAAQPMAVDDADAGADAAADAEPAPLVVRDLSRRAGPAAACYCSPKARRMPRRGERSVAGLRR